MLIRQYTAINVSMDVLMSTDQWTISMFYEIYSIALSGRIFHLLSRSPEHVNSPVWNPTIYANVWWVVFVLSVSMPPCQKEDVIIFIPYRRMA